MKKWTTMVVIILLCLFSLIIGYFVFKNGHLQRPEKVHQAINGKFEDIKSDLDGDGNQETLRLSYAISGDDQPTVQYMVVLDKNGKEIGPHSLPIPIPLTNSGKTHILDTKIKQRFVSFDFSVGPHSSETMFYGLQQDTKAIAPVCLTSDVKGPENCLFWSGEIGELVVKDLDNDGVMEIVETVDEYPKDGDIDSATERIINKEFKDNGQETIDGMIRISKREQGGRGNKVVWGIYRFNGNFFEEQTGTNYNRYYALVSQHLKRIHPTYPTIMRKTTMSKDSLDFNLFMRKFWTKRS